MPEALAFQQLGPNDLPEVFGLWSDLETVQFTNWTHTPTLPECAARLERVLAYYARDDRHFGPYVLRGGSGRFLGLIGADHSRTEETQYEVWYILARAEWGKGIASQAVADLTRRMTESGRVTRAVAMAVVSNPASARVLEKTGFSRGAVEANGFSRHGHTLDFVHFSRDMGPTPTPPAPRAP